MHAAPRPTPKTKLPPRRPLPGLSAARLSEHGGPARAALGPQWGVMGRTVVSFSEFLGRKGAKDQQTTTMNMTHLSSFQGLKLTLGLLS